jgi:transaldolase
VVVQELIAFRRPLNDSIPASDVDNLIGPDTVSTLREPTSAEFKDHGTTTCTVDQDISTAAGGLEMFVRVGVDVETMGITFEDQGMASFHDSFAHVLSTPIAKAHQLARS